MRLAPPTRRAYSYRLTVPPATLPVTLDTFKAHIKITNNLEDALLTLYLKAAVEFAERYTGRDLITRTYITFRDFFPGPSQHEGYYAFGSVPNGNSNIIPSFVSNVGFEIRKSPLQEVDQITYVRASDGSTIVVDSSIYYFTTETDYSELLLKDSKEWPNDSNNQLQNIQITFKSGFANDETGIEACWQIAILNHAASLEANRGDCSDSSCMKLLPANSKAFYEQKKLINL